MAFPYLAVMYAAGTYTQMQGQAQADKDQADALAQNASFFREQADYIQKAGDRELSIFTRKSDNITSAQIGAFARSAVDFSDSSALWLAAEEQLISREKEAIKAETQMRVRQANFRATQAGSQAEAISETSGQRQFATLLGAGAQYASAVGSRESGSTGPKK